MLPIIWEGEAERQFDDALDYIAARNVAAADRLEDAAQRSVSRLSQLPMIGRPGRVAGTRDLIIHPNYIVIYRVARDRIQIVRFLHARQRYP